MERVGGVVLHPNLRIHSSIPRWVSFSRSRGALPSSSEPQRRMHRSVHRRSPRSSSLANHFWPCTCGTDRGYLVMKKELKKSQNAMSVSSSCGPQEASLSGEEMRKGQLLTDCGTNQECVLGGIVALGKFDALHIGHRELAIQASKAGVPFLLSFVGMAEVLGWESRPPIVAKCDRKRVLASWAPYCGNVIPLEYEVEFSKVRYLNPRQFVERLSRELRVSGVVAGENYRFGYRASGDATELVRLCNEYGLEAFIVSSVMDRTQRCYNGSSRAINQAERGQVSSTRVRRALAMRDMEYVAELLGRKHRLLLMVGEGALCTPNSISAPKSCLLNQPPDDGMFDTCTLLVDNVSLGPCRVIIEDETVNVELDDGSSSSQDLFRIGQLVGIEFGW